MSTAIIEVLEPDTIISKFGVDTSGIDAAKLEYAELDATIPEQYKRAIEGRAKFRATRLAIETRRKELNSDALKYTKDVNAAAKTLTALVEPTEEELDAQIKAADKIRDDAREAKANAARLELEAAARATVEAAAQAERDRIAAEDARLAAERDAMRKQLAEQQERIAQQQHELDEARAREAAEREARLRSESHARQAREEQERKEREKRDLEEQERLEGIRKVERQRQAEEEARIETKRLEVQAQHEAAEAAERAADEAAQRAVEQRAQLEREEESRQTAIRASQEAEERRVADLERRAALDARREALKPDCVKLRDFANSIRHVPIPEFQDAEIWGLVNATIDALNWTAQSLEDKALEWSEGTLTMFSPQGGFVQVPEADNA